MDEFRRWREVTIASRRYLLRSESPTALAWLEREDIAKLIDALFSYRLADALCCDGKRLSFDLLFDPRKAKRQDLRFVPQNLIALKHRLQAIPV